MGGSPRPPEQLRPVRIKTDVVGSSLASAFITQGRTQVLVTANAERRVPGFLEGTERGRLVEVQGSAEGAPFSLRSLQGLLALARRGTRRLVEVQKKVLQR